MNSQKYIAIGDIHGCVASLKALIDQLKSFQDRTFIFVGDYIDRGPSSKEVVNFLIGFQQQVDCVFLRGNHEQMMLNALNGSDEQLWLMNGGRTTINSYEKEGGEFTLSDDHQAFYDSLELYYETPDYFFVHAGVDPSKTIKEALQDDRSRQNFMWERSHLNSYQTQWEKTVVFGHTPRPHPIREKNMIGIDTGCVYNRAGYGRLTAVSLPEVEFVQQDCID